MQKKYFYIFFFILFLSFSVQAQDGKKQEQSSIEGLTIYPNPVNTGKIYINSKSNIEKKVEIFDVLGKKVLEATTLNKEINIGALNTGVYIVKIRENEVSVSRKLIIN